MPDKLTIMARHMLDIVDLGFANDVPAPYVVRTLPNGLEVIAGRQAAGYYLVLRREDDYPTPVELQLIAAAFDLDLDVVQPSHYRRSERHPVTNRQREWACVRLQWSEPPRRPRFSARTTQTLSAA